jgi:hypothetical protein
VCHSLFAYNKNLHVPMNFGWIDFFFGWQLILELFFLTNQSIFGLWISSHESLNIIGFEGDLITLNMKLEINLFMCIFKGWVSWVTYLEARVCPSITSHSTRFFLHNSSRYYCLPKFSSTKHGLHHYLLMFLYVWCA